MSAIVLVCGNVFDGKSEMLTGAAEILVEQTRIKEIGRSVRRPPHAEIIDLSEHTVSPGFIDCHVHLTMDASALAQQTLDSTASKALTGLHLARQYMRYGFTTLRDLGSMDPIADISATEKVDFVMRDGVVYHAPAATAVEMMA